MSWTPRRATAVVHAVVAGQVAGGLGCRDDVVGGDGVREVGEATLRRSWRLSPRGAEGLAERAIVSASTPASRNSRARRPEPAGVAGEGLAEVGHVSASTRGVVRVPAEERRGDEGRVRDGAGEGPDLVERGGEGHQPVAADAAPGGLEARRRRRSAAGWRIDPPVSVPRASGTSRAATAAADPPDEPPGTRRRVPRVARRLRSRCSRSRSPWRTRPCWSCRARPRPAPRGGRRRSPRRAVCSPRGPASRRSSEGPRRAGRPSPPGARRRGAGRARPRRAKRRAAARGRRRGRPRRG